jgi:hypothetical protein
MRGDMQMYGLLILVLGAGLVIPTPLAIESLHAYREPVVKVISRVHRRSWTVEQLQTSVQNSVSYRQALLKLGLKPTSGNYRQLQQYVVEYGLDTTHFKGQGWSKGVVKPYNPKIPLETILQKNFSFQSFKLKKKLFRAGLKPQHCEECGWAQCAEGGRLPLELDHINGDRNDNRLKNLRILCPNCHSLKSTHRGLNMGRYA